METVCRWLSRITGQTVSVTQGLVFRLQPFHIEIPPPSVKFKFEGKWAEYPKTHEKHWECYYEFLVGFEMGMSISLKVDLIYAIGSIPQLRPMRLVYTEVKEAMDEYLNDGVDSGPPFYIGIRLTLSGGVELKRAPDWQPAGYIKGEGQVMIGCYIKAGFIEAEMEATAGVSHEMRLQGQQETVDLKYDFLKFEGVKGKVAIKIDTGWFGSWGMEEEAQIIDGSQSGLISGSMNILS